MEEEEEEEEEGPVDQERTRVGWWGGDGDGGAGSHVGHVGRAPPRRRGAPARHTRLGHRRRRAPSSSPLSVPFYPRGKTKKNEMKFPGSKNYIFF